MPDGCGDRPTGSEPSLQALQALYLFYCDETVKCLLCVSLSTIGPTTRQIN